MRVLRGLEKKACESIEHVRKKHVRVLRGLEKKACESIEGLREKSM